MHGSALRQAGPAAWLLGKRGLGAAGIPGVARRLLAMALSHRFPTSPPCLPHPAPCRPRPRPCPAQREPLRLSNNWGMAAAFFLMWDALLLALLWWAVKRFGSPSVRQWRVSGREWTGLLPGPQARALGWSMGWGGTMPRCRLLCARGSRGRHALPWPVQWWLMGGTALALVVGEAAWSWVRYRREVRQAAERAAARLARIRARAQRAAYCAAAATRVWPEPPPAAVRWPADAPAPAAAVGRGKPVDPELRAALLADECEP